MLIEWQFNPRLYLDPETLCNLVEEMGLTDRSVYMLMGCMIANMIKPVGEEGAISIPTDASPVAKECVEILHKHGYAEYRVIEGKQMVVLKQGKFTPDLVKRSPLPGKRKKR